MVIVSFSLERNWTLASALTCYILIVGQVTQVSPDLHKEKPVTV